MIGSAHSAAGSSGRGADAHRSNQTRLVAHFVSTHAAVMSAGDEDPACQFDDADPLTDADLPDERALGMSGEAEKKLQSQQKVEQSAGVPDPITVTDISLSPSDRIVFPITEVPEKYRSVFQDYPYFNILQSKLLPDLLQTDSAVAVCAPTGSGKTALFELAIIRILMLHAHHQPGEKFIDKIIYLSPLKSICNERRRDWVQKLQPLGCKVCELTGDSDVEDYQASHTANLIITTPEKWDAMTRKWRDSNRTIMKQTRLICIDEVHLLSEQSRGATLETIVSRVKAAKRLDADIRIPDRAPIRFVAVSASAPNIADVAQWLTVAGFPGKAYKMSQSDRPVKLTHIVKSIKCNSGGPFVFDQILNRPIAEAITAHGNGKPVLIFCMTRASTIKSAKEVSDLLPVDNQFAEERKRLASAIRDKDLREYLPKGVAFHNAGLDMCDRQIVEDAFRQGRVRALFSTSTLAMGVNLPAYMVILKGVHKFCGRSLTEELSETELLQMTGRAGRPQFDDHGVAVIFCPEKDVLRYQRLINCEKILESYLHKSLPEHMNSEVVLQTIHNKDEAVEWIKSTFFYIRCVKNKKFYDIAPSSNQVQVDRHLNTLCCKELNGLNKYGMIKMSEDGSQIEATEIGRLMSHYCVSFETMKLFVTAKSQSTLSDLLMLLCSSKEVKQETLLRQDEKKILFSYSDPKDARTPKIRFVLDHRIKEVEHKVFTIWQIEFGCIEHDDHKRKTEIQKTLRMGKRLAKCLLDVLSLPEKTAVVGARTLRNAVILAQVLHNGLWETTGHVARQLRGIGPKFSADLVRAGLKSFDAIRCRMSYELEAMCNRKPPFGNELLRKVRGLPIYHISGRQVLESPSQVRADFTVDLMNRDTMQQGFASRDDAAGPTAGRYHTFHVCISDSDDKVIFHRKLRDENLLTGPISNSVIFSRSVKEPKNKFTVSLLSESWIGIDVARRDFTLRFTFLEANVDIDLFPGSTTLVPEPQAVPELPLPDEALVAVMVADEQAPSCNHKCKDKSICLHDCCKTSARVRRAMRENFPMQKSAVAAKKIPKSAGHYAIRKGINVAHGADNWFHEPDESVASTSGARLQVQPSGMILPDTVPTPFFPKPVSYSATRTTAVSPNMRQNTLAQIPAQTARTSGRTRTPKKRRSLFVEEDEEDDGFEVVVSNLQPDRPLLSPLEGPFLSPAGRDLVTGRGIADMSTAATAATSDPSPGLTGRGSLIRFAPSPLKKYRTVSPASHWHSTAVFDPASDQSACDRLNRSTTTPVNENQATAVSTQWQSPVVTSAPQYEQSNRLLRFAAPPGRKYRTQAMLPAVRRSAAERGMDFRSNLTPVANFSPEPVTAGVGQQFRMNFGTNVTPVPNVLSPANPRSRTANQRGMDFRTFVQSAAVAPQVSAEHSTDPTPAAPLFSAGGDRACRMKECDEVCEKMLSEVYFQDDELDRLIKQLMQDE